MAARRRVVTAVFGVAALALAGCGGNSADTGTTTGATSATTTVSSSSSESTVSTGSSSSADGAADAEAALKLPSGEEIGTVTFTVEGSQLTIRADVSGLEPGFKGFHLHAIGKCEPASPDPADPSKTGDFLSAGGHLGGTAGSHPGHTGDLSSLQVGTDGTAELVTDTDRLDLDSLLDDDGTAVMVHKGPDNFANIPTRYAPTPDADTLKTGDSGGRAACGVVQEVS